jgi:hypothetical protein
MYLFMLRFVEAQYTTHHSQQTLQSKTTIKKDVSNFTTGMFGLVWVEMDYM